jgi:hypothetical protein
MLDHGLKTEQLFDKLAQEKNLPASLARTGNVALSI